MAKLTLYITRHGKTIMNTLNRVQGWCDSPLTPAGIEVAEQLGKGLADISFQAAYCSTLRRTYQTAEVILRAKGQSDIIIREKEGLKEAGFGSFESMNNNDLWKKISLYMRYLDPNEIDKDLETGKLTYGDISDTVALIDPWKKAEDWKTLETRTQTALRDLAEEEINKGSENVLVVAHGMSIASMLLSLGGDKLIEGDIRNASVSKVIFENGEFTVHSMGDMSYVETGMKL